MKISEVQEVLEKIKKQEDDIEILGISVNNTKITVCYEDFDFNIRCHKVDYKNCDKDL